MSREDIHGFFSLSADEFDITDCQLFGSYLTEAMDVSNSGSWISIIHGQTGQYMVRRTRSVASVFEQLQNCTGACEFIYARTPIPHIFALFHISLRSRLYAMHAKFIVTRFLLILFTLVTIHFIHLTMPIQQIECSIKCFPN